jgi:crotonobetainyl-CoA:carnitine CoA-transferase CaiB-like acyl-CoA transferase
MVAGPYCAKLMADMGAEVIKVEPPGRGDEARSRGPFLGDEPDPEKSGLFLYLNTNKLGITLDPETATGKRLFKELIERADILVEDQEPRRLQELGLGYGALSSMNPGLVVTSVTTFGHTGPYRDFKAYPLNTFHSGGEGYMTPFASLRDPLSPGRPPLKVGTYTGEYIAGIGAAGATLVATSYRERSGRGQHVDISKQQSLLFTISRELHRYPLHGQFSSRFTRVFRFSGSFECRDGFIMVSPQRQEHFGAFCDILGPQWPQDEKHRDWAYVEGHAEELRPLAERILRGRLKNELYAEARAKKLPLAPQYTLDEVVNCRQGGHRGFFTQIDHPGVGVIKYPTAPYKLSETPWQARRSAPLLGEHNHEVYCGRMGYSLDDFTRLKEAGVI